MNTIDAFKLKIKDFSAVVECCQHDINDCK